MLFKKEITLTPLGGVGEVGRSKVLYESEDHILGVDCGIVPSGLEGDSGPDGSNLQLPQLEILDQKIKEGKKARAIITHAHLDHIGGIKELIKRDIPITISDWTKRFFTARYLGSLITEDDCARANFITFPDGCYSFEFGNFWVECFSVNHSIPSTHGVLIKAKGKTVLHLTDFKFNGLKNTQASFEKDLQQIREDHGKIDCLLLDVLNIDLPGFAPPEEEIIKTIGEIIEGITRGRIFITFFASNVQRLGEIVKVCRKLHRPVKVLGWGMKLSRSEFLRLNDEDYQMIKTKKPWPRPFRYPNEVILLAGCQGEENSALSQAIYDVYYDRFRGHEVPYRVVSKDTVINASRNIPGKEEARKKQLEVLYQRRSRTIIHKGEREKLNLSFPVEEEPIHTSGHEHSGGLIRAFEILEPEIIIPIHATPDKVEILAKLLGSEAKKLVELSVGERLKI